MSTVHLGDGVWQHVCVGDGHADARIWEEVIGGGLDDLALEGLAYEWGLYDDLPKCLVAGEPLVEYGVVEYRYRNLNPGRYAALVDRYSHTSLGPSHYTATSFIAGSLGRLSKRGDLVATFSTATGYWSYNGIVSYWGLPGTDVNTFMTWDEFARSLGLDPGTWRLR